jgi:uncharacterized protein YecE (DUF72 family)
MATAPVPEVFVGTSGFSYPAWRGPFYPQELPAKHMLPYYAQHFRTVEINNTFYRMPTAALLAGWGQRTPAGFRFALKAPQRITHQLRLQDAAEPTARFCALTADLGPKRGALLFQLPPYLRADAARLDAFLGTVPAGAEVALEFRHASWLADEVLGVLRRHQVALCVADGEALATPLVATAPFGYLRLRRPDYAEPDLDAWRARLCAMTAWTHAYLYFKHDDAGRAAALARAFASRLVPLP